MPSRIKTAQEIILYLVILSIFVGVTWQVAAMVDDIRNITLQIWKTTGQTATWRGVNFSAGQKLANYLTFLTEVIPPDQQVIIPPEGLRPAALARTPYMQFFLAPRKVINCTEADPDCVQQFLANGAAILAVRDENFPAEGIAGNVDALAIRYVPFDQNLGVYLPVHPSGEIERPKRHSSLAELGISLFWPLAWVFILAGAGSLLVIGLGSSNSFLSLRPVQMALGFGIGTGSLTLLLYLVMLFGLALSKELVIGVTFLLLAGYLLVFLLLRSRGEKFSFGKGQWLSSQVPVAMWFEVGYLLVLCAITCISMVLAVGQGYHASDEVVLWGVKGYGIALNGLKAGVTEWGTRTTNYPLHIPVLIAAMKNLFGETLPQSKIIFPLYLLALSVLLYYFLKCAFRKQFPSRSQLPVHLAGGLSLLYATVPLIFYHSSLAYANLPLTYALVGASLLFITALSLGEHPNDSHAALHEPDRSISPAFPVSPGNLLLSGLFIVLASWTRPEGLVISILMVMIFSVWLYLPGKPGLPVQPTDRKARLASVLALFVPLGIFAIFWGITAPLVYQEKGWSQMVFLGGLERGLRGQVNLEGVQFVLNHFFRGFFDPENWGILGMLIILSLVGVLLTRRFSPSGLILILVGLICFVTILGMYFLIANDPGSNISWWVDTGLSRMLLPGMTLTWLGVILGLSGIWNDAPIL